RVLDSNSKPIRIPGGKVTVSRDGTIMVDNIRVGRLKVVDFPTPYNLIKVGDSLYMPAGQQRPEDTDAVVIQGALEGSNVNIVKEMALMIDTIREFESFQRTIKSIDDMSSKAINEIGRI
ncbi:MAG: flagellar basal-body rod protein FlgF, partial [Nitrospirae bacterium]